MENRENQTNNTDEMVTISRAEYETVSYTHLYKLAKRFSEKSDSAKRNAEMLGLMVNEPNVKPEELVGIQTKTLVIAGTKDMIKEEHTRLIAASIPDARLVFISGNHFIANKHPTEFNQAVIDFLKK